MLSFLEKSVLRFALLPYYRRFNFCEDFWKVSQETILEYKQIVTNVNSLPDVLQGGIFVNLVFFEMMKTIYRCVDTNGKLYQAKTIKCIIFDFYVKRLYPPLMELRVFNYQKCFVYRDI